MTYQLCPTTATRYPSAQDLFSIYDESLVTPGYVLMTPYTPPAGSKLAAGSGDTTSVTAENCLAEVATLELVSAETVQNGPYIYDHKGVSYLHRQIMRSSVCLRLFRILYTAVLDMYMGRARTISSSQHTMASPICHSITDRILLVVVEVMVLLRIAPTAQSLRFSPETEELPMIFISLPSFPGHRHNYSF